MTATKQRKCEFSPCMKYRYTLWRQWSLADAMGVSENRSLARFSEYLMVVGLNPSTADDKQDDPTIRRCINFAKAWGFGALCMTNIFAWRDTDPSKMKAVKDPVGPKNDFWLQHIGDQAGMILAAWGTHGWHLERSLRVTEMLPPMVCLGTNKDGSPKHPLYVRADTETQLWP